MEVKIFPYTKRDGIRTMRDSDILGLYDQMVEDGSAELVFYAGHIKNRDDFLKYMKAPGVYLYILEVNKDVVGVTWLDKIEDKTAFNHFCVFSNFWGKNTAGLGRVTLKKLINIGDVHGFVFDVFKGTVPVWNKRAIEFAQACGGMNLGVVPNGIWNAGKHKSEDAAFIYYTRETMK